MFLHDYLLACKISTVRTQSLRVQCIILWTYIGVRAPFQKESYDKALIHLTQCLQIGD